MLSSAVWNVAGTIISAIYWTSLDSENSSPSARDAPPGLSPYQHPW